MKMIRNKQALVRMLEAIIAILILLGFFIFTMSKQAEKPKIAEDILKLERKILEEVSDNPTLRESVLLEDNDTVKYFIASRLYPAHSALNFSIAICDPPGEECILSPKPLADIYVDDIVIGSLLRQEQQPKVLRLFIWIEAEREVEVPPAAECGNGILERGEGCDDSNTISGDGCSATCEVEPCYPIGEIIYFGSNVGECEEGQRNCTETGWVVIKDEVEPSAETCNGLDDDCDWQIDEDLTQWCDTGYTGGDPTCEDGVQTCTAGSWGSCEYTKTLEPEVGGNCGDGEDNDCNGLIDDC